MPAGTIGRIFGIVDFSGQPVSDVRLAAMAGALAPATTAVPAGRQRPARALYREGAVGLGYVRPHGTAREQGEPFPYHHAASGVWVTGDVRLYDRAAPAQPPPHAAPLVDGRPIMEAYLRWGDAFPAHVHGDFAVAVWDPRDRCLLLARDHVGCAPLFHARQGSAVLFASDLNGVLAGLGHVPELDPEWTADLLAANATGLERTPYPGVQRALAGHVHRFDGAGTRRRRYWDLGAGGGAGGTLAGDRAYEEAFRELLDRAVRSRVPDGADPVGAELSGGLDSSAVAALAGATARARGAPFVALTQVLPDALLGRVWPYRDEREWAARLVRHAGIDQHVLVPGDGTTMVDTLRRYIRLHAAPTVSGYSVLPDALLDRAQAHGVGTIFSGFGGDELVSGAAGLVLEGWVVRGETRQLLREFAGRGGVAARASRRALLRDWVRLRRRPGRDGGRRLEARTLANAARRADTVLVQLPVTAAYAERWALRERILAEWLDLAAAAAGADVRAFERYQVLRGGTAARLEACNLAAAACGIDYRYPLLDVPLLEFVHAAPPEQKWRLGWGRYLFRRGTAGAVPDALRWRADKQGVTIPNGLARYRGGGDVLSAVLADARRRPELEFIDLPKLDRWADALLAAADGRGTGDGAQLLLGLFNRVLALIVYHQLRAEGWRPGRSDVVALSP